MSSDTVFTTPERKKRSSFPSPPAAPTKKRVKMAQQAAPAENALLLITIKGDGDIATYCSNHAVLAGIGGHFGSAESFLSDELFESVLGVVGGSGYSSVNRDLYDEEEIAELKESALLKLFSKGVHGGGEADPGDVFRGTVVM
ncbi:unnamed protein product [Ectocarpus sp. 12 AP-2014]